MLGRKLWFLLKRMKSKTFIEKYCLPEEDDETYREYREGLLAYDEEFLIEAAHRLGIKLIDLEIE